MPDRLVPTSISQLMASPTEKSQIMEVQVPVPALAVWADQVWPLAAEVDRIPGDSYPLFILLIDNDPDVSPLSMHTGQNTWPLPTCHRSGKQPAAMEERVDT
jgi:hypothetical protein